MLISSLFESPQSFTKSDTYGFPADLDPAGLKTVLTRVAENYCVLLLGKSKEECSEDLKGCGLNDNCPIGSRCTTDKSLWSGYKCSGILWI